MTRYHFHRYEKRHLRPAWVIFSHETLKFLCLLAFLAAMVCTAAVLYQPLTQRV